MGKTLLAYSLFLSSKKLSIFVTTRHESYFHDYIPVYRSVGSMINDKNNVHNKAIFVIQSRSEFYSVISAVNRLSNCNVFIDELSRWVRPQNIEKFFEDLIVMSRPQNVNIILMTVRPQLFGTLVISQTDVFVLFEMRCYRDIEYVGKGIGEDLGIYYPLVQFEFLIYGLMADILQI